MNNILRLRIIQESPSRELLEPIEVGIRLYLGEKEEQIRVAPEILEIGKDVRDNIIKMKESMP